MRNSSKERPKARTGTRVRTRTRESERQRNIGYWGGRHRVYIEKEVFERRD